MNVADRLLAIHIDAITHAAPVRRKRHRVPTTALLVCALLMIALAAWR